MIKYSLCDIIFKVFKEKNMKNIKKHLGLILEGCAFILGCIVFLTMMGDAVAVSALGTSGSVSCYDLVTNNGGLFITGLVLICVALALIICLVVLDLLKVKIKFNKWLSVVPALLFVVGGVLFFFGTQCFDELLTNGEGGFNELVGYLGGKVSLGWGAIVSGILALLSGCTLLVKPFIVKK